MLMDSYIFSIMYKLIHVSLPFNPATNRMGNAPNVKNKKSLNDNLHFIGAIQTFSRLFISELIINLKNTFNVPFRIALKTIIMGTSCQFYDGAQSKFYPHLTQKYFGWIRFKRNLCQGLELPFKH